MFYEYRCNVCGGIYETQTFCQLGRTLDDRLCECGGQLLRICSVPQVSTDQDGYWNYTVGSYVTSTRDFEQKLRVGAERMSERLGYEQKFAPVYPSEKKAYNEQTAGNDGAAGESMEKYGRLNNLTNQQRTIIT